jgi:hypothetical protein
MILAGELYNGHGPVELGPDLNQRQRYVNERRTNFDLN